MKLHQIWHEQCDAARDIQNEFGTDRALTCLVGEKFVNFLYAAETDEEFREEIPAFVAGIRGIFERWQLAAYLDIARQTERFNPVGGDQGAGLWGLLFCCRFIHGHSCLRHQMQSVTRWQERQFFQAHGDDYVC